MGIDIDGSRIVQRERTKVGGDKEVLTELYDSSGNKISESYYTEMRGEKVTLEGDETAIIQHPDGSISYFESISGAYQFKERLIFSPSGKLENVISKEEETALGHELGLIESARHMFYHAKEVPDEFSEIE